LVTEQEDMMEERTEDVEEMTEESACDCSEELEQLERDKAQLSQQLLRLKADFDNFRRRTQMQIEEVTRDANKNLIEDLLPILDNFERALQSDSEDAQQDPFIQGMAMVYNGLMATLANHGLQPIAAKGELFDPCLHEAVAMEGEEGDDCLVVLEQIQTGYLFNEKVLRHTKVLVGQNKEEEKCQK
jgi:molecular chaperone GrpE